MKKIFVILTILVTAVFMTGCVNTPKMDAFDTVHPQSVLVSSTRLFSCNGVGPKMFETKEQCNSALLSGNCSFYEPKYFGLKKKKPANGVSRVIAPSERNQCVLMTTVNGRKWVAQKEGTLFRHTKDGKGNLNPLPYARDDCGNPVYALSVPSTEVQVPVALPAKNARPAPIAAQVVVKKTTQQSEANCFIDSLGQTMCKVAKGRAR